MTPWPLFDANGNFGKPASDGGNRCPTLETRLQHMDKLGISRALVWNTEAAQHHSLASNQRLLEEIASTPGAGGRIVPELVISPLLVYEADGIERLRRQMQEGRTQALRFLGGLVHVTLCQCEPVIRAVRDLHPFILLGPSETSVEDILAFTAMFPDVPVILTNVGWGKGMMAFDLMRRRPNIMLEVSWLHTMNGIALAVKHFGATRLLFGTGLLSHNGAALAALARAEITAEEKEQIAHGNLDRLTGSTTGPRTAGIEATNGLWRRMLAGDALGVDIVDAHGHLGPSGGYVLAEQYEQAQIPAVLRTMDRLGQRTMIVSGLRALLGSALEGNQFLHKMLQPHADRFPLYLVFNPLYGNELTPRFDEWFSDPQFVGFKILCSYWKVPVTEPCFDVMWEYANRRRLPVLMHSWGGNLDSPAMVREIVAKYPDLSLLLGHSGGTDGGRAEAEDVAEEFPNVFLEWCGSFCSAMPWEDTLMRIPASRVVYGSDAAAHDVHWEMGRLLSMEADDATLTAILGTNMRRILARRR